MLASNLPATTALSEAKEMLGPGTDTTSASLAHILWALAHDIPYQDALFRDLEAAGWPTDVNSLDSIPLLRAAIREGIRWTGAAAAMLPRVVPGEGAILAGVFVPGGVGLRCSQLIHMLTYFRPSSAALQYGICTTRGPFHPQSTSVPPVGLMTPPNRRKLPNSEMISTFRSRRDLPPVLVPSKCLLLPCLVDKNENKLMLTGENSFANFELLISVAHILKEFKVTLLTHGGEREAFLPERLEWVAAVPSVNLDVCFVKRR